MRYTTKKAILEHLGKNGRDIKQLDRLIKKWVVISKEWRYAYRCDLEIAHIRKLKAERGDKTFGDTSQLKSDLDFQIAENERITNKYEDEIKWILRRCYEHMEKNKCLPYPTRKEFLYRAKGISMEGIDSDFRD
jgi:hypothetical protein